MISSIPTFVPTPPAPILSFTSQSIPSGKIARFSTPGSVLTSAALTKPITGSLTLEGWIKPTSEATTDVIATLSAGSHAFNLSNPTDLTLTLGTSTLQTGIALATGSWRHIAVALKPGQNGKFSVWVVVDNSLLFQAASVLDAPTGWPDNHQSLTIGKKGNGTALQGDYSEFRLWSKALPPGLIQTHYYNRILTGAANLSLVWSLKAQPANAVKTDVTFLAGDLTYFSDTLTAQWSVETGTTYGLFLQAQDNVWGEIYSDLTVGTQPITEYWLNHGITAKLQATQLSKNSAFSPISSGALFRLGLPQATLSATITNAVPKLELNWPAVDQTTDYIVTFHETGTQPTSSSQKSLTKDISNLLLIAKPTTIVCVRSDTHCFVEDFCHF